MVASEAKSEFLSFVCHELRNPLSGIIAIVDMLMDNKKLKGEQLDSVSTIKQESELMCAIVNDVLDYAKIEANMLILDPVEFDVHGMISKALGEQKEIAKRSCQILIYYIKLNFRTNGAIKIKASHCNYT